MSKINSILNTKIVNSILNTKTAKIILVISLFFFLNTQTFAVSATPTQGQIDQIQKIKEMVASKVAELKLVEKRGILGKVKDTTGTKITVMDNKGNERIIDTDELTKFQDDVGSSKNFGISDIKKDEQLSFVGLYNKDTERLLARIVTRVHSIPDLFEGMVTDKNLADFTLTAVDELGVKKVISIENTTKTSIHSQDGILKSGFTKIAVGQRILAVGFADKKIKNQINATRIIHFDDLPPSSQMAKFAKNNNGDEVPVSSGSGKKLTPITQ